MHKHSVILCRNSNASTPVSTAVFEYVGQEHGKEPKHIATWSIHPRYTYSVLMTDDDWQEITT